MLSNEDKKFLARFAVPCLKRKKVPFSILEEIEKKKPEPTEEELGLLKQGIETGNISEDFFQKFFPIAYSGVIEHGIYKYPFLVHNLTRMDLPEKIIPKDVAKWCTIYIGEIVGKTDSEYIVKILDDEEIKSILYHPEYHSLKLVYENNISIGSSVAVHRYTIFKVLDEKEIKLIEPFYSEFLRTKKSK